MPAAGPIGLIVDWGGVLTTPVDDAFDAFVRREAIDPQTFRRTMRAMHDEAGSLLHQVEVGLIPRTEFEAGLAALLQPEGAAPLDPAGLIDRMFADAGPNVRMREIVRSARERGWRTAVLSNSWGNTYDEDDLLGLVDVVLLSERLRVRKPGHEAYLAAADALGVDIASCVMVDDLRRNAAAAQAVGMTGFQYRPGTEQALEDLLRRLEQR